MDRPISTLLFLTALGCLIGAALLLLGGFIEYLQVGFWRSPTLLQAAYDSRLVDARWFLANPWSWWIHDLLDDIPAFAALLALGPAAWWGSNLAGGR